jgi:nonribosomal peptide synthetase protein VioO
LITHPAVGGAVVVGERVLGRTSLAAYVVAVAPTTSGELKHYLRQRLPSQFVPSRISFVTSMKYTTSGKVDRAATQRAAEDHRSQGAEQ